MKKLSFDRNVESAIVGYRGLDEEVVEILQENYPWLDVDGWGADREVPVVGIDLMKNPSISVKQCWAKLAEVEADIVVLLNGQNADYQIKGIFTVDNLGSD